MFLFLKAAPLNV
uniref:Uncharacterized protein n=1 Tax=Anguilla anguilla TaxID=7936 RepID=A0A0E9VLE3_ANGAN